MLWFVVGIYKVPEECLNIRDPQKKQECVITHREESALPLHPTISQIKGKVGNPPTINVLTLNEGFEGTTFPPQGWSVYNEDGGSNTWERYTSYCRTGSGCASVEYETPNNDWLVTPAIVIDNASLNNPTLSFYYRTSSADDANIGDSLNLYISTDNGSTWTKIWQWDGTASTSPVQVSIDNSVLNLSTTSSNPILLKFVFYDNDGDGTDETDAYITIDSLKLVDGSYVFLMESWTANNIFYSAGYDTTTTSGRNWEHSTNDCPFSGSDDACISFKYLETNGNTGEASLTSPIIYVSPHIVGFWYQSRSTSYVDSFDVYVIKWNNQSTPPQPSDFESSGILVDSKYPKTGILNLPYIYTAYDVSDIVGAGVGDTIFFAIKYDADNQWRLYVDDVIGSGVKLIDLPPTVEVYTTFPSLISPFVGAKFYDGIPDSIMAIVSDDNGITGCDIYYRYVINPNQEGQTPTGSFTQAPMTLSDASPGVFPDTFYFEIPFTDRGLRFQFYVSCEDDVGQTTYFPEGGDANPWKFNIMPSGNVIVSVDVDAPTILKSLERAGIDAQADILLPPYVDDITMDSLHLWSHVFLLGANPSSDEKQAYRDYLNSGTCISRKNLIIIENDFGYFSNLYNDTLLYPYLHFHYISDDITTNDNDSIASLTTLGTVYNGLLMTSDPYPDYIIPDDTVNYENTSVGFLKYIDADTIGPMPYAGLFYNGLGYYTFFLNFDPNKVDTSSFPQLDSLLSFMVNFEPIGVCVQNIQVPDYSEVLPSDGLDDTLSVQIMVSDPSFSNPDSLRVKLYYRFWNDTIYNVSIASYDSTSSGTLYFSANIILPDENSNVVDSIEMFATVHVLNYGVYGPPNLSNTATFVYEYEVINAPLNFSASTYSDSVVLTWSQPIALMSLQGYTLQYSEDGSTWNNLAELSPTDTTYVHRNLGDEYRYNYRIRANYVSDTSNWVYADAYFDILGPRFLSIIVTPGMVSGNTLPVTAYVVFHDITPLSYDSVFYWTNADAGQATSTSISNDTLYYEFDVNIVSYDTLNVYFVLSDTLGNTNMSDTITIPINTVAKPEIPKKFSIEAKNGVITFALPQSSNILLEVYSIAGRKVLFVNNKYSAGYARFDLNRLPSGIYVVRASAGPVVKKFKVLIINR